MHSAEYNCKVCHKKFTKFVLYEGHFDLSIKCRSIKNLFQCWCCKKNFRHSVTLKYHLQLHSTNLNKSGNHNPKQPSHQQGVPVSDNIQFNCNVCERSFRSLYVLNCHLNEHNLRRLEKPKTNSRHASAASISSVLYRCKVCKIFLGSRKRHASHMNVHTNGELKCEICKIKFTEKSLRWHNKLSHPHLHTNRSIAKPIETNAFIEHKGPRSAHKTLNGTGTNKSQPKNALKCEICNIMCENRKRLECHLKVHVDGQFKCEICQIWFTKRSLDMHEKRLHPQIRKQRKLEALRNPKAKKIVDIKLKKTNYTRQCTVCKLVFINEKQLDSHMQVHIHGDVECEICQIRYTKRSLEMHMRRCHAELRTQQMISKALERNAVKLQHTEGSKGRSAYKCSACKLHFQSKRVLDAHMSDHNQGDVVIARETRFTKRSLDHQEHPSHPEVQTKPDFYETVEKSVTKKHSEIIEKTSKYKYQCSLCNRYISAQLLIKIFSETHKKVHTDGDLECEICQVRFTKFSLRMHEKRCHPELKKLESKPKILKSPEQIVNKEPYTHEVYQQSDELLELLQPVDHAIKFKHQCDTCHLLCQTKQILDKHKIIHIVGTLECEVCHVMFTAISLAKHRSRAHPDWTKKSILKAVENTSFSGLIETKQPRTTDALPKIQNRRHTVHISNAVKSELQLIKNRRFTEYRQFKCEICSQMFRTQIHLNNHTKSHFQCYICKENYENMSHLSLHIKKHILYQQWVDPLNVHLSNWNATQSREILQNQPLVLVENLDITSINLKSLGQYGQQIDNGNKDLNNSKVKCSIDEPDSMTRNEHSQCIMDQVSLKMKANHICESFAQNHVNPYENLPININRPILMEKQSVTYVDNIVIDDIVDVDTLIVNDSLVDSTVIDSAVIDISSGEDSDVEAIDDDRSDRFFCYFCEGLFHTCNALGAHVEKCAMR